MYDNPEQAKLASLIISIVILIIIVVLIVIVCCNWNSLNANNANNAYNTNANANNANANNQPLIQNPQALAAAAMYNKNQGMNMANAANAAANAVRNNPQKAALGAYAYNNKNSFAVGGKKESFKQQPIEVNGGPYCQNVSSYLTATCLSLGPNNYVSTWKKPPNAGCVNYIINPGNHISTAYTCTNAPQYENEIPQPVNAPVGVAQSPA